jgi:hypothetical protein
LADSDATPTLDDFVSFRQGETHQANKFSARLCAAQYRHASAAKSSLDCGLL